MVNEGQRIHPGWLKKSEHMATPENNQKIAQTFDPLLPEKGDIFVPSLAEVAPEFSLTEEPSFANLQAFATEVIRRGNHLFVPLGGQSSEARDRTQKATTLHLFTNATHEEIGTTLDNTKQRSLKIVVAAYNRLYEHADLDLKEKYDQSGFSFRKPYTLSSRIRLSRAKGGKSYELYKLIQEGKSAKEIVGMTNSVDHSLSAQRKILKDFGIEVPYKQKMYELKLLFPKLLEPETTPEEKQNILDQLPMTVLHRNYTGVVKLSDIFNELKISVSGRHPKLQVIVEYLKSSGIPVVLLERNTKKYPQRYGFIAEVDRGQVKELLASEKFNELLRVLRRNGSDSV